MEEPFKSFLDELAKALDFSVLIPDAQGSCFFELPSQEVELLFEQDTSIVPNTILLSSQITSIPQEIIIAVLEESLIGNFEEENTVSCHPSEPALYLHRRLHQQMSADELKELIEDFVTCIHKWREKIRTLSQNPPATLRIPIPSSRLTLYPFKA